MGTLIKLPLSRIQKMALFWQDEERAFEMVLESLRSSRRFDLVLKLDTFLKVRRRRIMNILLRELRADRDGASADGARAQTEPAQSTRKRKRPDVEEPPPPQRPA